MACAITLPLWSQAINCVSWSKDNLIAVGGGEQIAILTPRLTTPGSNGTYWDASIITANEFSREEVPLVNPLSFYHFSLGEELSLRNVHALEWSSPGLDKFGRCMLAVLSANHVLSLWSCDGTTTVDSNWRRTVVINHALKDHYARAGPTRKLSDLERNELRQVQQRVRAFAWAPNTRLQGSQTERQSPPSSRLNSAHQFLAVSTEAGDVVILRLRSPYDILAPKTNSHTVDVIQTFNADADQSIDPKDGHTNGRAVDSDLYANHDAVDFLAWSEWFQDEHGECCAYLTYMFKGRLFYRRLTWGTTPSDVELAEPYSNALTPTSASRIRGPLKFAPGTQLLIAFAEDRMLCVDMEATLKGVDQSTTSHHLDDRWDEMTGVAFTHPNDGLPTVHFVSHLSSASARTTNLPLPLSPDDTSVRPLWQRAIRDSRSAYSAEHHLAGNVAERVCGISNSPLGDYIITVCTLEPSDCVVYPTPSDMRAVLNITNESSLSAGWTMDPGLAASASVETMLFDLQQLADIEGSEVEVELALKEVTERQSSFADDTNVRPPAAVTSLDGTQADVEGLVRQFRSQVFSHPDFKSERRKLLFDLVYKARPKTHQVLRLFLEKVADLIVSLPSDFASEGTISRKIRANYTMIKSRLSPGSGSNTADPTSPDASEECGICGEDVPFESLKWAKCGKGHQFSRCALTLFAIQEPGISKRCGICGMQCLNEWLMPELAPPHGNAAAADDRGDQEDAAMSNGIDAALTTKHTREPDASLARILFASFDYCIYCRGKFIA